MTREEIIKGLNDVKETLNKLLIHRHSWMYQPIDEAIKALSAEPCEDCIRRAEAIEINKKYHGQMPNDINHQIWQELNDLPSIQPKWISSDDFIKSLEAEYYEDCISRKAVLSLPRKTHSFIYSEDYESIDVKLIEALPSIQPKPMQVDLEGDGYADGELVYDYGKCPKCGWDFEYGDKDWEEPYCCHCGQKLHWFEEQE